MQRGKIIGAIVLAAAVGLIVSQRVGEREEAAGGTGGGGNLAGQPSGQTVPGADPARAERPAAADGRVYTIVADQSEVYWRIYRAGLLARLGHNHVISISELEGSVTLGGDPAAARWSLSFPVATLVVDDPAIRARHGEDFEAVPSENDKQGTRENMLSDRLLDGVMYPEIRLEGTGLRGSLADAELPVSIRMLGRTVAAAFPAAITLEGDTLTVAGEYRLTHEDLGLSPFTALGGQMAVGDEIDFTYRIRAVAGGRDGGE